MEKNIVPFAFGDSLIRVVNDENGEPWFVAKDVCKVLDIQNNRDAISALDDDEISEVEISDTSSNGVIQRRKFATVSESGLYALVFRSRKPEARAFSKWVRAEVLPALRKTGRYEMPGADAVLAGRHLRPALRERLLNDALQMARLCGVAESAEIDKIYAHCCELVTSGHASRPGSVPGQENLVRRYIAARLMSAPGRWLRASRLYDDFRCWWASSSQLPVPAQKYFGSLMRDYYCGVKRGGYYSYRDCAFI